MTMFNLRTWSLVLWAFIATVAASSLPHRAAAEERDVAAITSILADMPREGAGWQSSIAEDDDWAFVWNTDAKSRVQIAYMCDRGLRFQAMALRLPGGLASEIPPDADSLGVAITDDVPGEVTSTEGTVEKFSGGTSYSKYKMLPDPKFAGGMMAVDVDNSLAFPGTTDARAFALAGSKTGIAIYDAQVAGKPKDEDLKMNIAFRAKGSTAAFRRAYEFCGIQMK